jgi:RimJ/RimL family protein N-acetyltransferase
MDTAAAHHMKVYSNLAWRGLRRRDGLRYATLRTMHRAAAYPTPRRWYYTPRSNRAYSVRQISPGDRRLLAEFVLEVTHSASKPDEAGLHNLSRILFDRVIASDTVDSAAGYVALENTAAGDRVIGTAAYAPADSDNADFFVAVANSFREEQVGRTLLSTLLRHAKRVGVPRLRGEMNWSNRPMQMLAMSMGFVVEPVADDRNLRSLQLSLK